MTLDQATIGLGLAIGSIAVLALLGAYWAYHYNRTARRVLNRTRHLHNDIRDAHAADRDALGTLIDDMTTTLNRYRHELALTPQPDEIVRLLADHGPLTPRQIADKLDITDATVAQRLAVAQVTHGLVERSTAPTGEFLYRFAGRQPDDYPDTIRIPPSILSAVA